MYQSRRFSRLILILLSAIFLAAAVYLFNEPVRRSFFGARKGVMLRGQNVERLFRFEVEELVDRIVAQEGRQPVDAVLADTGAIIPELSGLQVDREATVEAIMRASRGEKVEPVFREIPAAVRWEHYPSRPAYQGNPRKPMVALMINVAWGGEYIEPMLKTLKEEGAGGTFFLTGIWAEKNEELVRHIFQEGYELGNHGYSDAEVFPELSGEAMAASLRKTNEVIYHITGEYPRYFTPHKGEYDQLTLEIVSREDMRTVMWTLDTLDWQKPGVKAMREKIEQNLSPGQIILMHPTADTVALLRAVLPLIKQQGLRVTGMRELFDPVFYR